MQCACAILSSVACPALQYFSTVSRKRHDFRKKKYIIHKTCFRFSLQFSSEIFLGAFAKLRKATIILVMSVGPSVSPLGTIGSHWKDFS